MVDCIPAVRGLAARLVTAGGQLMIIALIFFIVAFSLFVDSFQFYEADAIVGREAVMFLC